jgi:hypothetical protein
MSVDAAGDRPLSERERALVARARDQAFTLYEGVAVAHRSCGIALAETFGLPTRPYQALRRGGLTGRGFCGSIRAGELVLGELLGDPDPAGPPTAVLRRAIEWYQDQIPARFDRGASPDYVCNNLTSQHGDFAGPARTAFCTALTAEVAALTCEALIRFAPDRVVDLPPLPAPTATGSSAGDPGPR